MACPDPTDPDVYVSINEACARVGVSRSTFYRVLADRDGGLAEILVRIPPVHGRIRVPLRRFDVWLRTRGRLVNAAGARRPRPCPQSPTPSATQENEP